ncbi:zinc carboxypeptidase family protein (macronuclear) [Tetrahymena thermophila SB210]|uniref:Zinc carboxypeptidase family protein n=1 Tax=Tetrahymena thermophila (strain SB210) TaxID=312017 RepID=I7LZT3_TETTS|nr:zinc carboxypeptidase family protein [Tetrahymena thermophila SB210]EAR84877.2 zinc carboxypeptidase family protein [Tetrahymena thermophila SB210]|eukprot:XP_001032540.2 zinc carboxypeptidase family protein [Tetrahymena thermophila SB210]
MQNEEIQTIQQDEKLEQTSENYVNSQEQQQGESVNLDRFQTNISTNEGRIKLQLKENLQKKEVNQKLESNENEDSDSNNSDYLPPPNPILNYNQNDDLVKTAYKFVFNKLPQFNEYNQNGKQLVQTTPQNMKFASKKIEAASKKDKANKEGTLQEIYGSMEPIYRKMDNTNYNFVPLNKKRYFSGLFCDLKKLVNDEKGDALTTQYDLISYLQRNSKIIIQQDNEKAQIIEQQQNTESLNKLKYKHTLRMDSSFESGNLFAAYQIGPKEYDLVLQNDTNSKGNTQWFFFSVQGTQKNQIVRFNIVNLMKNDSLFNYGMRPVVFSKKKNEQEQQGWFRGGFNISYFKNQILRESQEKKTYYTLQFSYKFENSNDTVYFAHCYPYTYTDLNNYLSGLLSSNPSEMSKICQRKKLCLTLAKNKCDILTITAPKQLKSSANQKSKQAIIIIARQHPGETPGSWMVEGVINYLCNLKSEEASYLREKCVFKVVPMVNPDGVIHGNYRTDLSGVDLNRNWLTPDKQYLTTVYAIKQLISSISREYKIRYIIDLHGHSKKMNAFFYGNPNDDDVEESRIFPLVCAEECKFIDFSSCTFKLQQSKSNTARIALFNQLFKVYKTNILTLEASFYGSTNKNQEKNHFTIEQYKEIGSAICKSMYKLYKQEEEYEMEIQKQLEQQKAEQQQNQGENSYSDRKQIIDVQIYKSMNVYERLFKNFKCDVQSVLKKSINKDQTKTNNDSSGSDSDPSADELNVKEIKSINENLAKVNKNSALNSVITNNGGNTSTSKQSQSRKQNTSSMYKNENASPTTFKSALKQRTFEEDEIKQRKNMVSSQSAQNTSIAIQTDYQEWLNREKSLSLFSIKIQDEEESIDIIDINDISKKQNNYQMALDLSSRNSHHHQNSLSLNPSNQSRGNNNIKSELKSYQECVYNSAQLRQSGAKTELPQYRKNSYWQQTYNQKASKITMANSEQNSLQQSQIVTNNEFKLPSAINSSNAKSISTSPMKNLENQSFIYNSLNQGQNVASQSETNQKTDDLSYNQTFNNSANPQQQQFSHLYKTIFRSPKEENQNFLVQLSRNTYKLTRQGYINYSNQIVAMKKNDVGPQATQLQLTVRDQKKLKVIGNNRMQSRQNNISNSYIETITKQNAKGQNIILNDACTQTLITLQSISRFCKTQPSRNKEQSPERQLKKEIFSKSKELTESTIIKQFNNNVNNQLRSAIGKQENNEKHNKLKSKRSGSQDLVIHYYDNNQDKFIEQKSSFDDINVLPEEVKNNQILLSNPSETRGVQKKRNKNQNLTNRNFIHSSKTQQVSPDDRLNMLCSDLQPLNIQLTKNISTKNTKKNNEPQQANSQICQAGDNLGHLTSRQNSKNLSNSTHLNQTSSAQPNVYLQQTQQNSLNQSGQSVLTGSVNNKNVASNNMVSLINNESQLNNKTTALGNNIILNKAKVLQIINTQFASNNQSHNSSNEINVQGINIKSNPYQSINLQAFGSLTSNIQTVNQKLQLLPLEVEITQKERRNSLIQNKNSLNTSLPTTSYIQNQSLQNKDSLNNKINRVTKNARSLSGQKGYGDSQGQQYLQSTNIFNNQISGGSIQNSLINQAEYYKYEINQKKDAQRRTSTQNKLQKDLMELSQTFQNDSQVKITQSDQKNKLNKLQQTHNLSFDSYNVLQSQGNLNISCTQNANQIDSNLTNGLDINSQMNNSKNINIISDNFENHVSKFKSNKEIIEFIKQQKANKLQTQHTTATINSTNVSNPLSGINQSMKIAFVQRQSRKVYNSPFNQRFLEKILN